MLATDESTLSCSQPSNATRLISAFKRYKRATRLRTPKSQRLSYLVSCAAD
jgi:hypothetical protein